MLTVNDLAKQANASAQLFSYCTRIGLVLSFGE